MTNDYYTSTFSGESFALARASQTASECAAMAAGFDKLPTEAELKQDRTTYAVTGGSANVYTVTLPYAPAGYVEGLSIRVKIHAANTGASTINVNGLGAVSVKTPVGGDPASGSMPLNSVIAMTYNGTNFIMTSNPADTSTTASAASAAAAAASAAAASTSETNAAASEAAAQAAASGFRFKDNVKAATTANITLSGAQTIDGISCVAADRVLVKDQTAPAENGIYVVAAGAWSRATDLDAWDEFPSATVPVEQGSTQADRIYICTSDDGGTLGTTAVAFTRVGAQTLTAAANGGADVAGTEISVDPNNATDTAIAAGDEILFADVSDSNAAKKDTVQGILDLVPVAPFLPVGTVIMFAANAPPSGFLDCDGAAISRTTYADLFTAIGTTFGVGDGSTTFNVPDLRGEFVRGWDDGKGTDSGRTFGSSQSDQNAAHTHTVAYQTGGAGGITAATASTTDATGNLTTGSSGGGEARPRNIALLYCIKT